MSPEAQNNIKPSDDSRAFVISLDAMGGDQAPQAVISGAALALETLPNLKFKIFGNKNRIESMISSHAILKDKYTIIHTEEVIDNDEKPSNALRKGRNSSMFLAISAVKNKEADAIVSSGNTGALMALSKIQLGTLPGIDRPAIGGILPTSKGFCVMLDLGANVMCEAENLFEFAVMGNAFARAVLSIENPSIGLLNIGAEKTKGNESVKAALSLLQESGLELNIHGFVEGDDISMGTTDVVVSDGFSGNIALKSIEGLAKLYTKTLKTELKRDLLGMIAGFLAIPAFNRVKKRMDPRVFNGAMLLGLGGIVVKSHGSSDEIGFANAIKVAYKLAKNNINEHISREMIASGHIVEDSEGDIDLRAEAR